MDGNQDVSVRVEGHVGRITLTRPQALNAINQPIVHAIHAALTDWEKDVAIHFVLVDAEGEKAFSAGGDLNFIYDVGRAGDFERANRFWREEYRLNALIDRYPKPYIAVMHGITMGGGVGVSCHGSHRIVGESSQVAMPECAVGLIPDVGGSWLLAQAPGHLGRYLGLTGKRMKAEDAIHAGFADLYVPRDRLDEMKRALVESGDVSVLQDFAVSPPDSKLARDQADIDRLFSAQSVAGIVDDLRQDGSAWALDALAALEKGSPISTIMTLAAIQAADSLPTALRNEYRFVSRSLQHGDFLEGIRAIVVDKDRNPVWRYPDIASVPAELIALMRGEAEGGDPDFNS